MADINAVISLGIGSPADIPHFLLVGLSINDQPSQADATPTVTVVVRARPRTVAVRASEVSA